MKKSLKRVAAAALGMMLMTGVYAQNIQLPTPVKTGGKPLMEALSERKSYHENYINRDLDLQTLSNMLWAAYGFNRADKRTVPSANNSQEYSIYVLLSKGAYLYDPKTNTLTEVAKGLFKDYLANKKQPYVNDVPVHLVFVANMDKAKGGRDGALIDVGYISQNVYLYAASKDLGTVARVSFDKAGLAKVLKLTAQQNVVLVQAVGPVK